ncbi:hypothetical protein A0128_02635 [Leptospira tipperaryensis]|uniref:Uncharacterized protein n=1 Tax=Leptospira tipperaryensis TaxID=2564040 RepID=A0A1D7UTJ9_9LEPT|nr:hypothetical protein [Leptospira tipperaryensis]AOP32863.1 hypothetical protein A0128_02635 [Leptospira tipperaryensis]
MKKIISLALTVFLFANLSLGSETILLKSGDKLEGAIVAQDKESVTFKLADGTTKVFSKSVIRKISFGKIVESPSIKKESQVSDQEKKIKEEKELAEKQKQDAEKLKSKEDKLKKREEELSKAKRHYFEGSFGVGSGESQSELRPFFQTVQYAALLFSSGGQAELQFTPYKSKNHSSTTRLFYAWNRFTFEIRGTEAKGNLDVSGLQTLSFGGGSGGSSSTSEKAANIILGNGTTKFQKVSSRVGFTPYPHPILDLQILGGIERIWTKTIEEVDSVGNITATGINPTRVSYRETNSPFKGYSFGIGFEWKFLERFTFQGQILRLDMQGPSSFRSNEFRMESPPFKFSQFGLDYQWKSTGTEVNLKFSAKVKGDLSLFVEASNLTLKNKLQSGYITENEGGGNSDPSQLVLKVFAPQILIPILLDSKTVLTYVQVGANYRLNF